MKTEKYLAKCKCCDAKLYISMLGQYFVKAAGERKNITKEEAIDYVVEMKNICCPKCAEEWLDKHSVITK